MVAKKVRVKKLKPTKTRAAETATWSQPGGEAIRVRDMEDAHLINTTHFVERALVTYDKVYGDLLKEARFRGLLMR